jgi:dipeptidyl aminopeptidase/acylaminoacyl peptidase
MDIERVGIWGHSGGGFASTRAVFEYPNFYDVAVSSGGNHDNRNYAADWGEKWQGLLKNMEDKGLNESNLNKTNYDNQANQLLAEHLAYQCRHECPVKKDPCESNPPLF